MIVVENRLYLQLDIGEFEDIADVDSNLSLNITESVGGYLPMMQLSMYIPTNITNTVLNEFTKFVLTLGANESDSKTSTWYLASWTFTQSLLTANLTTDRSFITDNNRYDALDMSAKKAICKILSEYYDVVDTADNSSDAMVWLNPGNTPRRFISEMLLHSYLKDNLLLYGITASGEAIVKDLNSIKYELTCNEDNESDFPLKSPVTIHSNSSTINSIASQVKLSECDIMESKFTNTVTSSSAPSGLTLDTLNRKTYMNQTRFANENTFSKFHISANNNLSKLSALSLNVVSFLVYDFYGINLLDGLNLMALQFTGGIIFNDRSGDCIVSSQTLTVVGNELYKRVYCVREGLNNG